MYRNFLLGIGLIFLGCYVSIFRVFGQTAHVSYPPKTPKGLSFVENKNQWPNHVSFGAQIPGGMFFMAQGKLVYSFYDQAFVAKKHHEKHHPRLVASLLRTYHADEPDETLNFHAFEVVFAGSNTKSTMIGQGSPATTLHNYYRGSDPTQWATGARAYKKVAYPELYPGIALHTYSQNRYLKYDFIVKPGADPDDIKMVYRGTKNITLEEGHIKVATAVNEMVENRPIAYQVIDGQRQTVACAYQLTGNTVTFDFPEGYNRAHTLVIDPLLIFSTYSGSVNDNWGNTATFGPNGILYSAGVVQGQGFPPALGGFPTNFSGFWDIGILKFDSVGSSLLYRTYLGGAAMESPHSLVVNHTGNLVLLSTTSSDDMPIPGPAYQARFKGGISIAPLALRYRRGADLYLAVLSPKGEPIHATFVGGSLNDGVVASNTPLVHNYGDQLRGDIIVDKEDNIYVASTTSSGDFFQANPPGTSFSPNFHQGLTDAVVFKMNARLDQLLWGGFLGGSGTDAALSVKLDDDNNVYVAGGTNSSGLFGQSFPTTPNTVQPNAPGGDGRDGFVTVIGQSGDRVLHSTFIGTSAIDQAYFLDLDNDGNVYVIGQTMSNNFPVSTGTYSNAGGKQFVQKLNSTLSSIMFSTVFGSGRSKPDISLTAFTVSDCDNLLLSGWGGGINEGGPYLGGDTFGMPVTEDAIKKNTDGRDFYLMALSADGSQLLYGSYFGGDQRSPTPGEHVDGGTSRFDARGLIYQSVCAGCGGNDSFPTSEDFAEVPTQPFAPDNGGTNCNNGAFKFDLASLRARAQTNNLAKTRPGIVQECAPFEVLFENFSTGGASYTWDFGDGSPQQILTTKSDVVHKYASPGTYIAQLVANDEKTCLKSDTVRISIKVYPGNLQIGADGHICQGDTYWLSASGGDDYLWESPAGNPIAETANFEVFPTDSTAYFVTVKDRNGCILKDTLVVNVSPQVNAKMLLEPHYNCKGETSFTLENLSEGADSIVWFLGDGTQIINQQSLIYKYDIEREYEVLLKAFNGQCNSEQVALLDARTINVYNVITPGGTKGKNDRFVVEAPGEVRLKIMNRWGKVIFEDNNYQNTWDAEGMAAGIYYYEVEIPDRQTCKSWLHVFK